MKKTLVFIAMSFVTIAVCYGGAIYWDSATFVHGGGNIFFLEIQEPTHGISANADIEVTTLPNQAILKNNLKDYQLSYGILLLQVEYNTLIDYDLFVNSSDPFFNTYAPSGERISQTDVQIPLYETVYLAFSMSGWLGWVEITYDDTGIHLGRNAMDMTWSGIYAGTGIVVPEPSAALLALSGFSLLLLRRRCRK